jgi:hypothetical protein
MMILDNKNKTIKNFIYFYRQRWDWCKNKNTLEYDFYCILIHSGRVFHFVIEFDGDQHYYSSEFFNSHEQHRRDILKQYYLAELNIHLLRLKNEGNLMKKIINFINGILVTRTYMCVGKIAVDSTLFTDKQIHKGLSYFSEYYLTVKNSVYSLLGCLPHKQKLTSIPMLNYDEIRAVKIKNNIHIRFPNCESTQEVYIFVPKETKQKYGFSDSDEDSAEDTYGSNGSNENVLTQSDEERILNFVHSSDDTGQSNDRFVSDQEIIDIFNATDDTDSGDLYSEPKISDEDRNVIEFMIMIDRYNVDPKLQRRITGKTSFFKNIIDV